MVLSQPSFITAFGKELKGTGLDTWKTYLKWQVINNAAPYLSKAFVDEDFAFNGKTLNGIEEIRPRWKRGVQAVEGSLGEAVGKIYVEKHFPPEAKARMVGLVDNLKKAYEGSINALSWMSDETKKKAQEKLAKFTVKIGYPDQWRDYSALEIKPGDLVGNLTRATEFEYQRNLNKLGKPIDRNEWGMTPQTVNAYYNPEMNEIVFPAAILQPPFFDANADAALNYGGIGAVIGHEMTHGYDDQGSRFDAQGNFANWWTKADSKGFAERTGKLVEQFNGYQSIDGIHVNGRLTLGENIADLGGLSVAYDALQKALADQPEANREVDGYSQAQRFFLNWSVVWRRNFKPEELKVRLTTDPHAPANFRAIGTPSNTPAFAAAFGCKAGDAMVRSSDQRVVIW